MIREKVLVSNNIFILLQVLKNSQVVTLTSDNTRIIKEKAKELSNSKMRVQKKEIGRMTRNMES